ALDESVGFTEVEEELDAAVREDALAAMGAGAVVRPEMVDQPAQPRRPPHAVAPAPERRGAPYRLEREHFDATGRIHAGLDDTIGAGWARAEASARSKADDGKMTAALGLSLGCCRRARGHQPRSGGARCGDSKKTPGPARSRSRLGRACVGHVHSILLTTAGGPGACRATGS